ncbi:ATP-binding cassette domain-containing protein [Peribacillus frigoritolerans]|nr:ATP-binding cassette domain-containing protein [Peribacillus frigoritolerans]UYY96790.1 ATP-binding cassette domain-containing protein [Peribacillus frigoritolerans]
MDKGSIFALLGSNGAGKTTVAKRITYRIMVTLNLMKPRINVR